MQYNKKNYKKHKYESLKKLNFLSGSVRVVEYKLPVKHSKNSSPTHGPIVRDFSFAVMQN